MRTVYELWHDFHTWTFFSTSLEEAREHAQKVCKERGWKYHGVLTLGPEMRISPQPTMPQPETNCPKIDGSKLSAHDQVTRDEFDQEAM
jgi:hypothetical protein